MLEMPSLRPPYSKEDRIAFYGPMVSGKSYCADMLYKRSAYHKVAFAHKLKQIAAELYGVTGKNGNDRTLLQALGEDLRKHDPEVWIKYLLSTVKNIDAGYSIGTRFVLDDLRYPNEGTYLRQNGFTLILVIVPEEERRQRLARLYPETPASAYYHESESGWKDIAPDFVIESSVTAPSVLRQFTEGMQKHLLVTR